MYARNGVEKDVEKFTYLGSVISKTGGSKEDVDSRIGKARIAFNKSMNTIWCSNIYKLKTKVKLFDSIVKSTLLKMAASAGH